MVKLANFNLAIKHIQFLAQLESIKWLKLNRKFLIFVIFAFLKKLILLIIVKKIFFRFFEAPTWNWKLVLSWCAPGDQFLFYILFIWQTRLVNLSDVFCIEILVWKHINLLIFDFVVTIQGYPFFTNFIDFNQCFDWTFEFILNPRYLN